MRFVLSRAAMLYSASVSFRFVSLPVSFYSIRPVPSHFVSVNAASYGDLRNAQFRPPLFSSYQLNFAHVFIFPRGTMGGRSALLLSTCVSVQDDFPEMQSHDALTPPRCITPAVRPLARHDYQTEGDGLLHGKRRVGRKA